MKNEELKKVNSKRYFVINKPYGVLTQFTDKENRTTLSSLFKFPPDVYPVGRLDMDSEGLLILSNDKSLVDEMLNPKFKHEREYYVQVEGVPDIEALKKLAEGVIIQGEKTLPAKAMPIDAPGFPERVPPIRFRKTIPTSWISLTLTEGKNRQVRKMTASVGYPTLRLVRVRIENILLAGLKEGEVRELNDNELAKLKKAE